MWCSAWSILARDAQPHPVRDPVVAAHLDGRRASHSTRVQTVHGPAPLRARRLRHPRRHRLRGGLPRCAHARRPRELADSLARRVVVFIYGIADFAGLGTTTLYAANGMRIPRQHHAPILATSVGAFWSRHYNLNVSDWLSRNFYRPLARRGLPLAGLALAFCVSAIFHVWLAYVPLDVPMALSMGAFFLLQGDRRRDRACRRAGPMAHHAATNLDHRLDAGHGASLRGALSSYIHVDGPAG